LAEHTVRILERIMKRQILSTVIAGVLCLGLGAPLWAATAKDETCNRAATAERERCQKRIKPIVSPADPKSPTESEQKAMDKHEKDWKGCIARAEERRNSCRF
jgi:hypothetical protein